MPEFEFREENRYQFIESLARNGLTLKNLSDVLGVSVATIGTWMHEDELFKAAWQRGRLHPDHLVEQALFRRAVGYQVEEIQEDFGLGGVSMKKRRLVKEIAPSEIACMFWLKNRLPHLWQDRVQHDVTFRDMMEIGAKSLRAEVVPYCEIEGEVIEGQICGPEEG